MADDPREAHSEGSGDSQPRRDDVGPSEGGGSSAFRDPPSPPSGERGFGGREANGPNSDVQRRKDDRRQEREWRRLTGLVYEFLAYLLVLGYIGHRLDVSKELGGWGLFTGLIVGMVAWIYRVLRVTRGLFK